jgi:hypothetical protein
MSVMEYEVGRSPGPPTRERVEVDPITLRVLGGAFHAIAKEMAGVLFRMSYSSIIRESEDLGAGIFDAEGRELCESDSTPMHIGSLPWYIRGFLHRLDGELQDGDVIVHNHPYLGASHSPDVAVAVPIFHEGELLGFAAVAAHVLDVGGSFPGINADAFDVYAEAKMYNALRWYEAGELNEDLDRMIFDNVRTETMNRGDMNAMLAACQLGKERFLRLVGRYGAEVVMSAAYDWMDYSERMLRSEIEKIHDGRTTALGIHALGVDAEALRERAHQEDVETRVADLHRRLGDRQAIVRVDRTELSKNIVRGLLAYRELLRRYPQWVGKVTHLASAYPSRHDLPEYREYTAHVQRIAGEIEDEFATADWRPIVLHVTDDYARSLALYRVGDVLLVNPVRDGMNLVAKEVPVLSDDGCVVVLSSEAGVADEFGDDALIVNPFDISGTADALHRALSMPADERAQRTARLAEASLRLPPTAWLAEQVDAL